MPITFLPFAHNPRPDPARVGIGEWDEDTHEWRTVEYVRIERLPRNVRPGDRIRLQECNDPRGWQCTYVTVRGVDSWPAVTSWGRRRHGAECHIRTDAQGFRWEWARTLRFYDDETRKPYTVYRKVGK